MSLPTAEEAAVLTRFQATGVLLEKRAATVRVDDHRMAYSLKGGMVRSLPLEQYRVQKAAIGSAMVMPIGVYDETIAVLPLAAEICDRVAPWVTVHLAPRVSVCNSRHRESSRWATYMVGDVVYQDVGGSCWSSSNLVMVTLAGGPTGVIETVCHELLHAMWPHLSDRALDVLKNAVSTGYEWPGAYYDDAEERVARLFVSWCLTWIEGMPPRWIADGLTVDSIFFGIWNGTIADEEILSDSVSNARALAARRGLAWPGWSPWS